MAVRGRGKIVNISSVHDRKPARGNSIYCISKSGLVMMTKALAVELAEFGIQVNSISPGAIMTDENAPRLADATYRAKVLEQIPAQRVGSVEDCVGAVVLLCSPESDYITGTSVCIDGGMGLT
jgi:NAD(P)-dependent dehydrogenase (short-subunit alcohol dehydrogenase family)